MMAETTTKFPPPLLISAKEAARLLGIGTTLLWEQTQQGLIPAKRIGTRVLYDPDRLRAWIKGEDDK
jgi:excisionase family DNA binding protein